MKFDLKKPCKNCPFSKGPKRITFSCRERAEEIEEQAYRRGFPCHLSAVYIEETDYTDGGYVAGDQTQHCAGSLMMYVNQYETEWPGIDNEELPDEYLDKIEPYRHLAFDSVEDFLDANDSSGKKE